MIKSVNNYPVSQLFDIEAGVVYAIPRYQREYTRKMDPWESLFDDIEENDPGYFLGSIICVNQTTDTLAVQRLEVVDGQRPRRGASSRSMRGRARWWARS